MKGELLFGEENTNNLKIKNNIENNGTNKLNRKFKNFS